MVCERQLRRTNCRLRRSALLRRDDVVTPALRDVIGDIGDVTASVAGRQLLAHCCCDVSVCGGRCRRRASERASRVRSQAPPLVT